jgi:hypothetical protein
VIQEHLQNCTSQVNINGSQQHCNLTTNCHQVSGEARVKENEDINNYGQP